VLLPERCSFGVLAGPLTVLAMFLYNHHQVLLFELCFDAVARHSVMSQCHIPVILCRQMQLDTAMPFPCHFPPSNATWCHNGFSLPGLIVKVTLVYIRINLPTTVNNLDLIRHGDLIHVNNPGHNEDTRVLHWQCLLYIWDKLFFNTIRYTLQYVYTS